jgi:hypothetical protein
MEQSHQWENPLISKESLQQGLLKLKKVKRTLKNNSVIPNDSGRYLIRKVESITFDQEHISRAGNIIDCLSPLTSKIMSYPFYLMYRDRPIPF